MRQFIILMLIIGAVNSASAQCSEAENPTMKKYAELTRTSANAQGCSLCAWLANLFCIAENGLYKNDKPGVEKSINDTKANIKLMGDPICCPELLSKTAIWGQPKTNEGVESNSKSMNETVAEQITYSIAMATEKVIAGNYIGASIDVATELSRGGNTDAAIGTVAVGTVLQVGSLLFENAQEKKRLEEQIRLEEEEKTRLENEIFESRKKMIFEHPNTEIPLYSKEKANRIYFFIYSYEENIYKHKNPIIYVSNVFEIGTYSDGTRVFTSAVQSEIADITPFKEVLYGYFYTKEDAQKIRDNFVLQMLNRSVGIIDVEYKGKPMKAGQNTTSNADVDFWGNETETKPTEKELNDFWGTPAPKTTNSTEKKEPAKTSSFWD